MIPITSKKNGVFDKENIRKIVDIVLIHSEITEGLTLRCFKSIHILEPIPDGAKMEQVIARIRRKDSHTNMGKNGNEYKKRLL